MAEVRKSTLSVRRVSWLIAVPMVLAAAGLLATLMATARSRSSVAVETPPVRKTTTSPYAATISGAGLVEASSENIAVGVAVSALIKEVAVSEGDRVSAGDVLLRLDDREALARLAVAEADAAAAELELQRLKRLPRVEELPVADAVVNEAQANASNAQRDFDRISSLGPGDSASRREIDDRRLSLEAAKAQLEKAIAQRKLLQAGAWPPDVALQAARSKAALARVDAIRTDLERLVVRAPISGQILKLNARVGQFAEARVDVDAPLLLMGRTDVLHVRVDIDDTETWRFEPGAPARAFMRGNPSIATDLAFVRVDPLVAPKRSLTGSASERTDTRVLRVVYSFPASAFPVYVGQLVDVRIRAATAVRNASTTNP
jgi:multidrug resistance efflux pump